MSELPAPETMLIYASILEKQQYHIDKQGRKFPLPTGEIVEAACAALRLVAGLWQCAGCGSWQSIDQIRGEHPEAIACCPERKMSQRSGDVGGPGK